jgi:hypothetical protein
LRLHAWLLRGAFDFQVFGHSQLAQVLAKLVVALGVDPLAGTSLELDPEHEAAVGD